MALYSMSFGFRQPYQVLSASPSSSLSVFASHLKVVVDSKMCKTAHRGAMDLSNLLVIVLQGTIKLSAYFPLRPVCFAELDSPS